MHHSVISNASYFTAFGWARFMGAGFAVMQ